MIESPAGEPSLTSRERRWLDALLVLGTSVVAIVLVEQVATLLGGFSDVLLIFFLAWIIAFVLSPAATALERIIPGPRGLAVLVTYGLLLAALLLVVLYAAQAIASSVAAAAAQAPDLQRRAVELGQELQTRLASFGLQLDVAAQVQSFLRSIPSIAQPASAFAIAGVGALGNVLAIVFLSLYMVLDRDRILAFGVRIVPPQYAEEARLLERSVSRSFGGFMRGQAIMGLMYGALAAAVSVVFGLDYAPLSATASGILQAIPFFGPFVSWAPPLLVALLTNRTDVVIPVLVIMVAGWMIVMNVVQPRLMADSVGIHPIVVLGSIIIGTKLAGVVGAIFGIPIAAVISSFFMYYLNRATADPRTVASRAAQRVAQREGRSVRVPVSPPLRDSLTEVHRQADLRVDEATGAPDDGADEDDGAHEDDRADEDASEPS